MHQGAGRSARRFASASRRSSCRTRRRIGSSTRGPGVRAAREQPRPWLQGATGSTRCSSTSSACGIATWRSEGSPDSGRAIRSGLDLVERTEATVSMPARIGINAGAVIAHEGDYFGRTVNIAARIADVARPHEVLVSEDARRAAAVTGIEFELVGHVPLRGVSKPVQLHRTIRAQV